MSEEVSAFGWGEEITDISDGLPEGVEASGGDASEMGLEFGEGHLDRVEIGTIGRQEEEPGASVGEALGGAVAFVDGEIVEDDDVALRQGRCELGLDVEIECDAMRSMALSTSHGALSPWQRRPAMKLWVRQCPNGAEAGSLSPQRLRPRSLTILVLIAVSSMKTSR